MDEGAVVSRVVSSSDAGVNCALHPKDAEVTGHRIDVLCPQKNNKTFLRSKSPAAAPAQACPV